MRVTRRGSVTLAAAVLVATPLAACGSDDDVETTLPAQSEQTGVGDEGDGGAAQESLDGRVGEDVEVTGEVAEVVGENAFTIGGDAIGENPILVVGADLPADLSQGDTVDVAGTVVVFQVAGYEEDLDLDLVDQEFEDFDNDPAIQASSVSAP